MPLLRAHTFSSQRLTLFAEHEGHRLPGFGSGWVTWRWRMGATPPGAAPQAGAKGKQAAAFRSLS